jgi:nucleoredoxin
MTTFSELLGEQLLQYNLEGGDEANEISTNELNGKTVALYFSFVFLYINWMKYSSIIFRAHWCPCRDFTLKLAEIYKEVQNELKDKFDIIFVSWDKNQSSFDEYFKEMPWKALPYFGM